MTTTTNPKEHQRQKAVFVTGANGYIGSAVCRAFVRAGWRVFGLVRRPEAAKELALVEATPVVGSFASVDTEATVKTVFSNVDILDAIVSCTEVIPGYAEHFSQVLQLVRALSKRSNEKGVRPLVLWSSGCKDYGTTSLADDPTLGPHVETSPLKPPSPIAECMQCCATLLEAKTTAEEEEPFDVAVIRPTSVFGYSSSYYGGIFEFAENERAKENKDNVLVVPGNPASIMHATHVDDCAEAYVRLAEHADRSAVAGQAFNISGWRYETLQEVADAVAKEYGFVGGGSVRFVPPEEAAADFPGGLHYVFGFSQWVGSDKVRALTGWTDRRALFSADLGTYRRSYEASRARGHDNIDKIRDRLTGSLAKKED